MVLVKSLCIALSAYSAIPMPQFDWDRSAMAYSLCFLPVVGALTGTALALWFWLCALGGIGDILTAVGATALPMFLTGGIHMDGFCDTVDALNSHQPPERCLEIMKDPRAGAFAVIYAGLWLLLDFGLYAELIGRGTPYDACAVFMLSRALTVLMVISMKNARGAGMLAAFTEPAHRRAVRAAGLLWALAGGGVLLWLNPFALIGASAALALTVWFYSKITKKRFGGVTGDTSGFFVQLSELSMLLGLVLSKILWR